MTDLMEERIMTLIFENTAAAEIGDTAGLLPSATANAFACALHTATVPDTATSMSVSECAYTGYARLEGTGDGTDRNSTDWNYAASPDGPMTNLATITFGTSTTSETITSVSLGEQGGGATSPFFATDLDSNLAVTNGVTPSFAIGALDFTLT
jgi:hypothetical protein